MRWEEWRAIEEVIEGGGGELWRDGVPSLIGKVDDRPIWQGQDCRTLSAEW
jgi:hypothetical protein